MSFILAIEPDRRQASLVGAIAHERPNTELVIRESINEAIELLAERVPDLILTSFLLSPKDGARLADRLRELDAAGTHVQTLVIPVMSTGSPSREPRESKGLLTKLRRGKKAPAPDGCDPRVFGAQIAEYLDSLNAEREQAARLLKDQAAPWPPRTLVVPQAAAANQALIPRAHDPQPVPKAISLRDETLREPRRADTEELSTLAPTDSPRAQAVFERVSDEHRELASPAEPAEDAAHGSLADTPDIALDQETVAIDERNEQAAASPTDLDSGEPEDVDFEVGTERWEDLGFAPNASLKGLGDVTTLAVDNGTAGEPGFILTAEPIDLAAFVVDLGSSEIDPLELLPPALSDPLDGDALSAATLADGSFGEPTPESSPSDAPIATGPDIAVESEGGGRFLSNARGSTDGPSADQESAASQALIVRPRPGQPSAPVAQPRSAPGALPVRQAQPSPELLQMLAAIRHDLERMRSDGSPDAASTSTNVDRRSKAKSKDSGAAPKSVSKLAPPPKGGKSKRKRNKRRTFEAPQDDAAFFDPEQCGFAALIAKLQEIETQGASEATPVGG